MSNQSVEAVFDALGEPVRRRILELLRAAPTPVGQLAERLPVGRPAVSKHLRVLSDAGLIEHRSAGTRNLYALAPDGMAAAQQWLVRTWDTALSAYAAEEQPVSTVPPICREIIVDADPAAAFEAFTAGLGQWWPMDELSVHGQGATVAFADGQIVERPAEEGRAEEGRAEEGRAEEGRADRGPGGAAAVWGTVTRWEPPAAVAFTWHPGQPAERASHVVVTFAAAPGPAAAGQTLVRLEHTGWDAFADPAAARAEYDRGWPLVLDRYSEHVGARGDDDAADTWVALLHRPGPAAPRTGSLLEDPRFGDHFAFLTRMREAGYLVLAGPLADADGEGMTILRLPGPGQLGTATRLATEDDASVAAGFLAVTVRPWQVMMVG